MTFNLTPAKAVAQQNELKHQIRLIPYKGPLKLIGGADVSFNKYSPTIYAGFVVLNYETLEIVDQAYAVMDAEFPYVPGLLSFREIPPLLKAWKKLKTKPDVMMFDGQGIAHPRRLGIAAHAGLVLDIPSLGCAKSVLIGVYKEPNEKAGGQSRLVDPKTNEQIGVVLRTKNKVNPVYISPGHRMDFKSSVSITQTCLIKHRLPEPTRQAHNYVNEIRKRYLNMSL